MAVIKTLYMPSKSIIHSGICEVITKLSERPINLLTVLKPDISTWEKTQ